MKLNVEKKFYDKFGELHNVGDVITVDKARGEELLADTRKLVTLNDEVDSDLKVTKKRSTKK